MSSKDKKPHVVVKSMDDDGDMQEMAEGVEDATDVEAMTIKLPTDPAELAALEKALAEPGRIMPMPHDNDGLLARALPFLLRYSHSGRGSRCPECGQVIGHNETCKLAALIAEIEKAMK